MAKFKGSDGPGVYKVTRGVSQRLHRDLEIFPARQIIIRSYGLK